MQQPMAVQHGVSEPGIAHPAIQAFVIGAFRQPDPQRRFPDEALVFPNRGAQLPAHRFRVMAQQGQVAVSGTASEQVHHPLALQCREALDQIAVAALLGPLMPLDRGRQVLGALAQGWVGLRQQIKPFLEPVGEALLEVLIAQQRQQRRG